MNRDILQALERAKREILADMVAGTVPKTCASFSELHDYVDANGYGGAFEDSCFDAPDFDCMPEDRIDFWNRVQDAVDQWLKERAVAASAASAVRG